MIHPPPVHDDHEFEEHDRGLVYDLGTLDRRRVQVSLESDNVFGDDGGARQLGTVTGNASDGYTVALTVAVED